MKLFQKKNIIQEIKTGNEEILTHLTAKYFQSVRRMLRIGGLRDSDTPEAFSHILASAFVNLAKRKTVVDVDFEKYLFTAVDAFLKDKKNRDGNSLPDSDDQIAAHCVSILDEHLQKLIYARVVEKLNYEKIAERFQYSNAVIAQYELDKAFQQLEGIVKLRMGY